jgi:uncharacterized membrane protein
MMPIPGIFHNQCKKGNTHLHLWNVSMTLCAKVHIFISSIRTCTYTLQNYLYRIFLFMFCFLTVLGTKSKVLCMLGKHATSELCLQHVVFIFKIHISICLSIYTYIGKYLKRYISNS